MSDPKTNPETPSTTEGKEDPKTKPKVTDARITPEEKGYLDKLIILQKEQEAKELETAKAIEEAKKLLEAEKKDKEIPSSDLEQRIKALEADNKLLSEKRKEDLLSFLSESDQKKYKEKSVEQLEILVDYLADNPAKKKGMRRKPTTKETSDKKPLGPGEVGSHNEITDEWG